MIAKANLTPKRFYFVAAALTAKISTQNKEELKVEELSEYFWADSKVVQGYTANDSRAFKTFAENLVQTSKAYKNLFQWSYIPPEDKPVDDASRGMTFKNFTNITWWF